LDSHTCFRINTPTVVHEIIDEEVVVIDFDTGSYYSMDHAGAAIWELIEQSASVDRIVEGIIRRYEGSPEAVRQSIHQFLAELQQENLIVPDVDRAPGTIVESIVETGTVMKKAAFQAPTLQKYADMQELLLLDPIHEVDETGWPNIAQEPDNEE
jgi:hypothetical protein